MKKIKNATNSRVTIVTVIIAIIALCAWFGEIILIAKYTPLRLWAIVSLGILHFLGYIAPLVFVRCIGQPEHREVYSALWLGIATCIFALPLLVCLVAFVVADFPTIEEKSRSRKEYTSTA